MMLSAGFRDQIMTIMSQLSTEDRAQFVFVSATALSEAKRVVRDVIPSSSVCLRIIAGEIAHLGVQAANLTIQCPVSPESAKKIELFTVRSDGEARQTMVFVESKVGADMLAKAIKQRFNVEVDSFHADKSQKDRLRLLEQFVNQDIAVMATTSVLGRGIDLLNVDKVVVFDAQRSVVGFLDFSRLKPESTRGEHGITLANRPFRPGGHGREQDLSYLAMSSDLVLPVASLPSSFPLSTIHAILSSECTALGGSSRIPPFL